MRQPPCRAAQPSSLADAIVPPTCFGALLSLRHCSPGDRHPPLRPTSARLILALDHNPGWRARRTGLHRGGGRPGSRPAPRCRAGLSPSQAHQVFGGGRHRNPSVGNFEELGDLYLDDGRFAKARECFDRVISPRTDSADPFYRRALAEIELGHHEAAADDLARTVAIDPKYAITAPPASSRTCSVSLAGPTRRPPALRKSHKSPRCRKLKRTMLRFCPPPARRPKPANGRSGYLPKRRRCRPTCGGASGHGSEKQRHWLKRSKTERLGTGSSRARYSAAVNIQPAACAPEHRISYLHRQFRSH